MESSKVLVVDDDVTILNYITGVLTRQKYIVLQASSGSEALEVIEEYKDISVIILDIIMPELNGFDVLQKIKTDKRTESIKVIMVSGKSEVEEKVRAFSLGAADYIEKPFASDELIVRIDTQVKLRKTEKELNLFKTIIEESKEAISISDEENKVVYVNPAYEKLFNTSSTEMIGKDFRGFYPEQSIDIMKQEVLPAFTQGGGWEGELEVFDTKGHQFSAWQRVGSIVDDKKNLVNSFCFMHDVSDRIEIVEAWRKYTFMANASKDLMTLVNSEYVYEAVNDAYCLAKGVSRDEIIGYTMEELWVNKFPSLIKNYVDQCLSGQEVHYEDWFEFNGTERRCFDVAYYPYHNSNDQITHIVVVSRDITERKKVEQSLRESQQYIQRISDTQPDILLIYNVEGNQLEYCNRQFVSVLGFDETEFNLHQQDGLFPNMHTGDIPRVIQNRTILSQAKDDEIIDIEYRLKDINGDWHWFYERSTIFSRSPAGNPRQILIIIQDITLKKETEKALERYQNQLTRAEKMAAVGRLLAAIMHEINNPLQAVQSCLSLIADEVEKSIDVEKMKDYLEVASSEVDRISGVIMRSRNFYQPIQGKIQELGNEFYRDVNFNDVDLVILINKTVKLIRNDIKRNQIELDFEYEQNKKYIISGHHDSLEQVLMNIMINAMDAISIKMDREPDTKGKLSIKLGGDQYLSNTNVEVKNPMIRLEIRDNGSGMAREVMERAFEPFYTTKESGSGLGLATCHQIIQVHEGAIELESEQGEGTNVIILLPVNKTVKGSNYVI